MEEVVAAKKNRVAPLTVRDSSLHRFTLASDRFLSFKSNDSRMAITTAFYILEKVSGQKTKGSPPWSIVFDTKNLQIHFKTIVNSSIREIHLQKIDFSCQSPVKMIDINEKLSGDITNKMKGYSTKMHFDHALSALKKWDIEIDPEELMKQIRFTEEFPCMDSPLTK